MGLEYTEPKHDLCFDRSKLWVVGGPKIEGLRGILRLQVFQHWTLKQKQIWEMHREKGGTPFCVLNGATGFMQKRSKTFGGSLLACFGIQTKPALSGHRTCQKEGAG